MVVLAVHFARPPFPRRMRDGGGDARVLRQNAPCNTVGLVARPEGEDSTSIRAAPVNGLHGSAQRFPSLDVLNLLAQLIDD